MVSKPIDHPPVVADFERNKQRVRKSFQYENLGNDKKNMSDNLASNSPENLKF